MKFSVSSWLILNLNELNSITRENIWLFTKQRRCSIGAPFISRLQIKFSSNPCVNNKTIVVEDKNVRGYFTKATFIVRFKLVNNYDGECLEWTSCYPCQINSYEDYRMNIDSPLCFPIIVSSTIPLIYIPFNFTFRFRFYKLNWTISNRACRVSPS